MHLILNLQVILLDQLVDMYVGKAFKEQSIFEDNDFNKVEVNFTSM